MQPISTLTGHSLRVLHLSMSPDGSSVVSGAGDETLRCCNNQTSVFMLFLVNRARERFFFPCPFRRTFVPSVAGFNYFDT